MSCLAKLTAFRSTGGVFMAWLVTGVSWLGLGTLVMGGLLAMAACRKPMPEVEPPRVVTDLVQELFTALERRDYAAANPSIARLRDLQPSNVYLAELERVVSANQLVCQMQEKLDGEDPAGAAAVVAEAIRQQGRQDELLVLDAEMSRLLEFHALVATCLAPPQATALARAASRLKTMAAADPRLAAFAPIADRQLVRARDLLTWERHRAVEDLCSDLDLMLAASDPTAETLLAVLAVVDPGHPTLKAWRKSLAGNRCEPPFTYRVPE